MSFIKKAGVTAAAVPRPRVRVSQNFVVPDTDDDDDEYDDDYVQSITDDEEAESEEEEDEDEQEEEEDEEDEDELVDDDIDVVSHDDNDDDDDPQEGPSTMRHRPTQPAKPKTKKDLEVALQAALKKLNEFKNKFDRYVINTCASIS